MRISDWSSDVCSSDLQEVENNRSDERQPFFCLPAAGQQHAINLRNAGTTIGFAFLIWVQTERLAHVFLMNPEDGITVDDAIVSLDNNATMLAKMGDLTPRCRQVHCGRGFEAEMLVLNQAVQVRGCRQIGRAPCRDRVCQSE